MASTKKSGRLYVAILLLCILLFAAFVLLMHYSGNSTLSGLNPDDYKDNPQIGKYVYVLSRGDADAKKNAMREIQKRFYESTRIKNILIAASEERAGLISRLLKAMGAAEQEVREKGFSISIDKLYSDVSSAFHNDEMYPIRFFAAETMGLQKKEWAIPYLLRMVGDENIYVASSAIVALGKIGDKSSIPMLMRLLGSSTPEIRAASATALGYMKEQGAVGKISEVILSETKDDPSYYAVVFA